MSKKEESKYPIADMGENFDPEAMEDYEFRANRGDFDGMDTPEIRRVYVNEEMDRVEHDEMLEAMEPPPGEMDVDEEEDDELKIDED